MTSQIGVCDWADRYVVTLPLREYGIRIEIMYKLDLDAFALFTERSD